MNEKTLLELKHEDERKERERRKITNKKQKEKENKTSQIIKFSKQKVLKEKIIIKEIKFSEIPKIVFDDIKINFKHVGLEKVLEFDTTYLNYIFLKTEFNRGFDIIKTKYKEKISIIPKIAVSEPLIDFIKDKINKGLDIKTSNIQNFRMEIPSIKLISLHHKFLNTNMDKDFYSIKTENSFLIPKFDTISLNYIFLATIGINKNSNVLKFKDKISIPKLEILGVGLYKGKKEGYNGNALDLANAPT
ncbi:MAG: hypothetical protein GXN95_04195, partial [Methanococci archaeon]|nr:hypothetical protein [Methanococci archaeon]